MKEEGGGGKQVDRELSQNILAAFFRDKPRLLVQHHIDSYDDFIDHGLPTILREHNPITISARLDSDGTPLSTCLIYIGGKSLCLDPANLCKRGDLPAPETAPPANFCKRGDLPHHPFGTAPPANF